MMKRCPPQSHKASFAQVTTHCCTSRCPLVKCYLFKHFVPYFAQAATYRCSARYTRCNAALLATVTNRTSFRPQHTVVVLHVRERNSTIILEQPVNVIIYTRAELINVVQFLPGIAYSAKKHRKQTENQSRCPPCSSEELDH